MIRSLFALLAVAALPALADVGIATGSPTGTYIRIAKDIQAACGKIVNITVHESAGSLSNLERILSDPKIQYGLFQHDALIYRDLGDSATTRKVQMIFPFYNEEIHVVAAARNIRDIHALAGKRVAVGAENSGHWITAQLIKAKTGLQWVDVNLGPDDAMAALAEKKIDAAIIVAGKPVPALERQGAFAKGRIQLVPLSHPGLDGFYIMTTIPEGIYPWQTTPIRTYAVKAILGTFAYKNPTMESEIRNLTRCIVQQLPNLQAIGHPKWREVDPQEFKQVKWGVHPAALAELMKTPGRMRR